MTIHKPTNFIEAYRAKALSKDINELTGRTGRPDLTRFVIHQMVSNISFKADSIVVDIGCGDGLFLQKAVENGVDGFKGRLIGILPTKEEVCRVREHLLNTSNKLISIESGLLDNTNLPGEFADVVVSNGTFCFLQNEENVNDALLEIKRIAKSGGVVFIGELPDSDEMAGRNYGGSITAWLFWVLKNQGANQFIVRLKQTLIGLFGGEPFVISPKNILFMRPHEFIKLLESNGFKMLKYYKHKEIDSEGKVYDSATRWDYLVCKI